MEVALGQEQKSEQEGVKRVLFHWMMLKKHSSNIFNDARALIGSWVLYYMMSKRQINGNNVAPLHGGVLVGVYVLQCKLHPSSSNRMGTHTCVGETRPARLLKKPLIREIFTLELL